MWYSMEEAAVNRGTGCGSGIRRHGECMRTPKMQMKSKRGDFMVIRQHMQFLSNDSITLVHAVKWVPEGEVKAVLQISHGMCEFVERYDEFAVFLAERGVLVVGNDHLGHGESIRSKEEYGYFAEENGNSTLIKDLHRLRKMVQEDYPHAPYFLLGHSMGSFLARQYICCYGKGLAGAVIMGTGHHSGNIAMLGMLVCKLFARVKGWRYRSRFVDALAFGGYNRGFGKSRAGKEWLTKDENCVKTYVADERCTFRFTLNAYYNMFLGLYKLSEESYLRRMPKPLPVLFAAGGDDPVGAYGKGVMLVYARFKELGMKNVKCRLYPGDRHEILNETDREKVYRDIYTWLSECLEGTGKMNYKKQEGF